MSARFRITAAFTTTVLFIALAFTLAIGASRTEEARQDAARLASATADLTLRIIQQQRTVFGTQAPVLVRSETGAAKVAGDVKARLDVLPGYVFVFRDTMLMYRSESANAFFHSKDWPTLLDATRQAPGDSAAAFQLADREVVLTARAVPDTEAIVTRVVTGTTVTPLGWSSQLIVSLLLVVLAGISVAAWAAWSMLGGVFGRVERIRNEVAAITDGRSLHRRLSDDGTTAELAALIETLNATIARLEGSFMALRRFTADASHELKTPLAVLRADVERAMHEKTNKTERMVALEEALHETTRMADLVESLLTLARADEGRFELVQERVDLGALTQEVYETALILGEATGVTVNLPFTTDVSISGDRARLRQLFLNLVTNAIKYTPSGGRVDIGLGRHPTTVTFAVRDTGIGIAAVDLPHIFERFWRADRVRTRTAERGGVGLGLAISQWIAQAHNGTLTVSSRLGRGSLFTVTLPLDAPDSEITEA
jgi:signal transduction histidine kinase